MAVSKRLRFEIFRRDNHACRYCGATAPDATLTIDHVVPVALGGADTMENLVTACAACNAGKSSSSATEQIAADVDQDTLRWADALRRAAELEAAQRDRIDISLCGFFSHWASMNNQWAYPPADWESTIERFLSAGLTDDDLLEAATKASNNFGVTQRNRWRYFCGICWRVLERRQETARAILASEERD